LPHCVLSRFAPSGHITRGGEKLEIARIGGASGGGWRTEIFSRRQKFRSNFFERTTATYKISKKFLFLLFLKHFPEFKRRSAK